MKQKHLIKGCLVLSLLVACVVAAPMLVGQRTVSAEVTSFPLPRPELMGHQWSTEQREVWTSIEKGWSAWVNKDLNEQMLVVHPRYHGWWSKDPLPTSKASVKKWASYYYKTMSSIVHELTPVVIDVHGKVACVHYFFKAAYVDADGQHKLDYGRWTETWLKEGKQWRLIADHGGITSSE